MTYATAALAALLVLAPLPQDVKQLVEQLKAIIAKLEVALSPPEGVEPGQLQAALNAAPRGSAVYLRQGAQYVGAVRVPPGIRLTTIGAPPQREARAPMDRSKLGNLVVNTSDSIYLSSDTQLDNVLVTGSASDMVACGWADNRQTLAEQQPTNVVIRENVIDGVGGAKRGVGLHCRNAHVLFNWIENFAKAGQDTQAIAGWNGAGPFVIEGNFLEAAGENIMFGGADPRIPGLIPANITIERNFFTKDTAWRALGYTQKNLLEFKVGRMVMVRGNIFEKVWQCSSVCQGGYAIMLTPQSQDGTLAGVVVEDVTIEGNEFRDVAAGVTVMGTPQIGTGLQSARIAIRRNWFRITKGFNGGAAQGWAVFLTRAPRDVTVEWNTIESDSNQIVYLEGGPSLGFRFVGNLVPRSGAYGFTLNGSHRGVGASIYLPGSTLTGNAFGSFPAPVNLPGNLFLATSVLHPLIVDGVGTGQATPYGKGAAPN
jgi:hypothetical protein